jgi:hypothetical protein
MNREALLYCFQHDPRMEDIYKNAMQNCPEAKAACLENASNCSDLQLKCYEEMPGAIAILQQIAQDCKNSKGSGGNEMLCSIDMANMTPQMTQCIATDPRLNIVMDDCAMNTDGSYTQIIREYSQAILRDCSEVTYGPERGSMHPCPLSSDVKYYCDLRNEVCNKFTKENCIMRPVPSSYYLYTDKDNCEMGCNSFERGPNFEEPNTPGWYNDPGNLGVNNELGTPYQALRTV